MRIFNLSSVVQYVFVRTIFGKSKWLTKEQKIEISIPFIIYPHIYFRPSWIPTSPEILSSSSSIFKPNVCPWFNCTYGLNISENIPTNVKYKHCLTELFFWIKHTKLSFIYITLDLMFTWYFSFSINPYWQRTRIVVVKCSNICRLDIQTIIFVAGMLDVCQIADNMRILI